MRKPRLVKRCNLTHNKLASDKHPGEADCEVCGDCVRAYHAKLDEYEKFLEKNPDKKKKTEAGVVSVHQLNRMLAEIRKQKNLKKFAEKDKITFCERYNIKTGQFNFLIAIVAAEIIRKKGISGVL